MLHCFITFLLLAALAGCQTSRPVVSHHAELAPTDAYLRALVGEWDIKRTIRGKVVGNHMSVEPVLGGTFVRLHMISTTPSDPYEAIVLVGYDGDSEQYVAHWCDSFGPGLSAVGRGQRDGQRLELKFDYPGGPFFNTWVYDPAADRWSFTGENGQPDGSRVHFASDVVTRHRDQ